ncbi:MAG: AMP-binding protein [Lachnospiraceae bacterium]|nr:AMP-binding protein [Lachnospiraceae bacterium]
MWNFNDVSNYFMVSDTGIVITYGELKNRISKIISNTGLDRKLAYIVCDNSIDAIIMYVALIQNKIPVMLVPSNLNIRVHAKFIEAYKPSYIWTNKRELKEVFSEYSQISEFLWKRKDDLNYDIYSELALLLLTSGTTGNKKTVRLSYTNIKSNMISIAMSLNVRDDDRAALMLPITYSYGLSVLNSNLYRNATLLHSTHNIIEKDFFQFMTLNKVSALCGVPFTYELMKKLSIANKNLESIRLMTQAGGHLDINTQRYFLDLAYNWGFDFAIMYGQTEATARMTCFYLNEYPDKIGSVGRSIENGKVSIAKDGEVIYYGKNVCLGYAESYKDLEKGDLNKGILLTGDMGEVDSDRFLYINGRKRRIAKICGIRINLDEIENKIINLIGIPVSCNDENGKLLVFFEDEDSLMVKRYYESIKNIICNFGINKAFYKIIFVHEIKQNLNDKRQYYDIL